LAARAARTQKEKHTLNKRNGLAARAARTQKQKHALKRKNALKLALNRVGPIKLSQNLFFSLDYFQK
jgi:phosphoribosyl-dephospho-CoA transferase